MEEIAKIAGSIRKLPLKVMETLKKEEPSFSATTRTGRLRSRSSRQESTGGGSENSAKGTATSKSSGITWEHDLETLMDEAEYEIHQDPYRGLLSQQQSSTTGVPITTPWNACELGKLPPEPLEEINELQNPHFVVRQVGHCGCPSLKAWTRETLAQISKKQLKKSKASSKKRGRNASTNQVEKKDDQAQLKVYLGKRPDGNNYVCPCDYNPLCLVSLGGVIGDVLQERVDELNHSLESAAKEGEARSSHEDQKHDDSFEKRKIRRLTGIRDIAEAFLSPTRQSIGKDARGKSDDILVVDDDRDGDSTNANVNEKVINIDDNSSAEIRDVSALSGNEGHCSTGFQNTVNTTLIKRNKRKRPLPIKPLVLSVDEVPSGNPAEIFTSAGFCQQDFESLNFSPATTDAILRRRRSIKIEISPIRSYIYHTLRVKHSLDQKEDVLTTGIYIKILREWHRTLQFHNPLKDDEHLSSDTICLSTPPGISNLGATCYLNTQLQCLAQNLTFLNGIFSWRMVNSNHNMNSVMSKLQRLLAEMFMGGDCTLTTLDFSNALGLEHYEQQDPNEFARLLFDRMDESFQQCDNNGDLGNLLKRIFHGVTTYETICMACNNASERSEGFMDLNLPIVKRPKPQKKNGTIKEAFASVFSKSVDTDIQYCLDQYVRFEMLDGDNQYFCSKCNCKQDAKRILKLTQLPPVLNVQLSRYVFDKTKFVKKKVSDKVLLPKSLQVETSGGTQKKYLLCAVMKHQGTSAYSGHYLAEAMDWLTGQWYEFNDEIVKLLPNGPSCSYDPTDVGKDDANVTNCSQTPTTGSQDAYNMYYVEENYLAHNASVAIERRKKLLKGPMEEQVLHEITSQRQSVYSSLSEMCFTDGRTSDRLNRRKAGIRKYLVQNAQSLIPKITRDDDSEDAGVWVSTDFLKRYFQCTPEPGIDSLLAGGEVVLQHRPFLCEHGYLAPDVAFTGKVLSNSMYEGLIALIRGERALLLEKPSDSVARDEVEDVKIVPETNLFCIECSKIHRDKLSAKLQTIKSAKELHDVLAGKVDDSALYYQEGEKLTTDNAFAYVLSRQTSTKFRRRFGGIMKSLTKFESGSEMNTGELHSSIRLIYKGLDSLDLSDIIPDLESTAKESASKSLNDDKLDKFFNTNITCPHGNSNLLYNGRQVRYVSWETWQLVTAIFPEAIQHRRRRVLKQATLKNEEIDEGCPICRAERDSVERLRKSIQSWAVETKENFELGGLLDGKRTLSREQAVCNFANVTNGCRLVHKSDIQTWRNAVRALSSPSRIKGDSIADIKNFVEELVFPSRHSVVLDFEHEPVDKLVASIRSYVCREHHLVIKDAIVEDSVSSIQGGPDDRKLTGHATVIGHDEYQAYINSLTKLLYMLNHDSDSEDSTKERVDGLSEFMEHVQAVASDHHPLIQKIGAHPEQQGQNLLHFCLDGSMKQFSLVPGFCNHETCTREFTSLTTATTTTTVVATAIKDDEKIESISIDSNKKSTVGPCNRSPSVLDLTASDPILVESDLEVETGDAKFRLQIFQVKVGASEDEIRKSLQTVSGLPNEPQDKSEPNFLRRSTRKRKTKYPCGVLLDGNTVEISLNFNLAALRLLMFERCGVSITVERLSLVLTLGNTSTLISISSIAPNDLQTTLNDLIMENNGDYKKNLELDPTHCQYISLLYWVETGQKNDQEALMESLIGYSNLDSHQKTDSAGRRKKSRPSERGFQGTLLQSSTTPIAANVNQSNTNKVSKPDASEVSDEEKHPKSYSSDAVATVLAKKPEGTKKSNFVDPHSPKASTGRDHVFGNETDSDVENILSRGPVFPAKKRSHDTNNKAVDGAVIPVDEPLVQDQSLRVGESTNGAISDEEEDPGNRVASGSDIRMVLVNLMMKTIEQPADESKVWDSVAWVINQNPDEDRAELLLDSVYAKYLSAPFERDDEVRAFGSIVKRNDDRAMGMEGPNIVAADLTTGDFSGGEASDSRSNHGMLRMALMKRTNEKLESPVDESKLSDSIDWVIRTNPDENIAERLLDSTIAKYLSDDFPDSDAAEVIESRRADNIPVVEPQGNHVSAAESTDCDVSEEDEEYSSNQQTRDSVRETLLQELLVTLESPVHMAKLRESIEWALEQNPDEGRAVRLVDCTVAKYLSCIYEETDAVELVESNNSDDMSV